jgi:alcohol dehydrogenase
MAVMQAFDFQIRTRVVFGEGSLSRLGSLADELSFTRTLIVADPGIVAAGIVAPAAEALRDAGVTPFIFTEFGPNPDTAMVEAGRAQASGWAIDSIVALGGGSSLDCAKGINFVLTNGGTMRDYWGHGKASRPMLPMIAVPTTAGTGSEAQCYAIISDSHTHVKMACGDPKAAFRVAILDPVLTVSQPCELTAVSGYDAVSHAVESYVTASRSHVSDLFAVSAWRLLEANYERVLMHPQDLEGRAAMLLGAHEAGIAIEQSMLGATHACANPLTTHYGTTHGVAISVMLPHVVRWNAAVAGDRYTELLRASGDEADGDAGERLAARLEALARAGGLPARLRDVGVSYDSLDLLATDASTQWTGTFNPRPFDATAARALYERAF